MRYFFLAIVILSGLLLTTGCTTDQSEIGKSADITFRMDSSYTWRDDTVPLSDTLHIGVIATTCSNTLRSLFVSVGYDNGTAVHQDSVHVDSNPFTFAKTVITRDQAGTEKWTFSAQENGGDVTQRSLTFTVQ